MLNEVIEKKRDRFQKEFQMRHKDGYWVDILSRANVVFDETGKAVRVVGTHIDITERKKAEAAILKEKKRAEQYLQLAGVMFIGVDKSGRVILANHKASEILERPQAEIVGQDWFDNLPGISGKRSDLFFGN
ncbi:PAS domain S-box protein [Desulfobacterales bacterium HSG2]|nr:PAS domain S-box protein [Desulfobacterales bacterium HSG2]